MSRAFEWYVGIDWGSREHAVVLLDAAGRQRGQWDVAHTAPALHACLAEILTTTGMGADGIAVGLEIPRGLIVDLLLEQRFRSLPSTRSSSTGFATDTRWPARKMTGSMRTSSLMPCGPINIAFARCDRTRRW